jgi:adenosylmethionine-8-amino-7-oxononanoate aminotransferase
VSAILHRNITRSPPVATVGQGSYLIDSSGRRYLDASGGAAVSSIGHGHPAVIAAVNKQIASLEFAHTSFFTNEPAEKLAQKLIELAPPEFVGGRAAFVGSGSEAVEAALKLARQHFVEKGEPRRTRFIARRLSYHGNSLGALGVGGHAARRAIYEPMLVSASLVSPCYAYRYLQSGESEEHYAARLASELEGEIERLDPGTVAAFILEPVAGATIGAVPPVPGYLKLIRQVCDRYGVLVIADEVMCGMGRCGTFFACAEEGMSPDILTVAKGLGAGYMPIGAVLAREAVFAPIVTGTGVLAHGHTYMSHPVACAAALAVLNCIIDESLLDAVRNQGALLRKRLHEALEGHDHAGDIRGRGLLCGIELVKDTVTRQPFDAGQALARRIQRTAQELGLLCYPSSGTADGQHGDHILLAPPFTVQRGEIDELVQKLVLALDSELALTH